ncbi:hypothetical protein N6H14_05710 [Paenibacillus sp. CC-CFT747]|nr:hypothetical protein N6H14_05710 [Paenibacillus sp. CC-CFT747]
MNSGRNLLVLILVTVGFVVICYRYYSLNYSQQAILDNVTSRDGYTLVNQQEQVPIELFIRPEWIPFKPKEEKNINEKLYESHNTIIHLKNIWNRGNDIYFSFQAEFNMKYKTGEFLYNGIFNEDGTFSSPSPGEITIYDKDRNKIPLGQQGYGPDAAFSFGVEPQFQNRIQNGFYIKYTGYILYNYSKK